MTQRTAAQLFRACVLCLAAALLVAEPAWAQTLQPLQSITDFFVGFLTGGFARSAAIIVVAVLGYMAQAGRLRWAAAGSAILGIALVFGAAAIVDAFRGAV